jgi:hypothetical protein
MAQLFHPSMTLVARAIFVGVLVVVPAITGITLASAMAYSDWYTRKDQVVRQPIPFSHEHHVNGLGLDCRFCHSNAADSSFAGMPATKTCMTCHSQIWWTSPMLAPVRDSWASAQSISLNGTPIRWNRVHDLPDYVYFDHSIHVNKGVGCTTCHGQVNEMPLIRRVVTLQMRWCLECHREPERFLRPREHVFDAVYSAPANQRDLGIRLVQEYHIRKEQLTNCSICHR